MAEAEQEVDIGRPRPDPLHRRQVGVSLIRRHRGEIAEPQASLRGRRREGAQGRELGTGQARRPQGLVRGGRDRLGRDGAEPGLETRPDGRGAGGGELLAVDDRGEGGETGLALAQARQRPSGDEAGHQGVLGHEGLQRGCETFMRVDQGCHRSIPGRCSPRRFPPPAAGCIAGPRA
jgi:hypothetical protein